MHSWMHFSRAMEEQVLACKACYTFVNEYRQYGKLPLGSDTVKENIFHFQMRIHRGLLMIW